MKRLPTPHHRFKKIGKSYAERLAEEEAKEEEDLTNKQ